MSISDGCVWISSTIAQSQIFRHRPHSVVRSTLRATRLAVDTLRRAKRRFWRALIATDRDRAPYHRGTANEYCPFHRPWRANFFNELALRFRVNVGAKLA